MGCDSAQAKNLLLKKPIIRKHIFQSFNYSSHIYKMRLGSCRFFEHQKILY